MLSRESTWRDVCIGSIGLSTVPGNHAANPAIFFDTINEHTKELPFWQETRLINVHKNHVFSLARLMAFIIKYLPWRLLKKEKLSTMELIWDVKSKKKMKMKKIVKIT